MNPLIGIVGTISGGVVGWVLGLANKVIVDRIWADRELRVSAFVCYDRLLRIKNAVGHNDAKQKDDEIFHLGGDMNRYLVSIAAATAKSGWLHLHIHTMMIPVLLEHKTDCIGQIVAELRKALGLYARIPERENHGQAPDSGKLQDNSADSAREPIMPAMNLRRGFLRLTLVVSILIGIMVGVVDAANLGTWNLRGALGDFAIGFGACWATYAIVRFLVIGFVIRGFKQ